MRELSDIYAQRINDLTVSADGEPASVLPTTVSLEAAYPNPFNPSVTIPFTLPDNASVTLQVYNILGERVATLVERTLTAGIHRAVWDGRADNGRLVASGTYFVSLNANSHTFTQRIVMMK